MEIESSGTAINWRKLFTVSALLADLCGTGCSGIAQKSLPAVTPAKIQVLTFSEKLDGQTADRWINDRWSYLMSYYSRDEDPYFGTSDVDKGCRERSVADEAKIDSPSFSARAVTLLTNEDGVTGVCAINQQTRQMRVAFVVCRGRDRQLDIKRVCELSMTCTLEGKAIGKLCE